MIVVLQRIESILVGLKVSTENPPYLPMLRDILKFNKVTHIPGNPPKFSHDKLVKKISEIRLNFILFSKQNRCVPSGTLNKQLRSSKEVLIYRKLSKKIPKQGLESSPSVISHRISFIFLEPYDVIFFGRESKFKKKNLEFSYLF